MGFWLFPRLVSNTTTIKCKGIGSNSTFEFFHGYEGIPETLFIDVALFLFFILQFAYWHEKKSNTEKSKKNRGSTSINNVENNGRHLHKERQNHNLILPPMLNKETYDYFKNRSLDEENIIDNDLEQNCQQTVTFNPSSLKIIYKIEKKLRKYSKRLFIKEDRQEKINNEAIKTRINSELRDFKEKLASNLLNFSFRHSWLKVFFNIKDKDILSLKGYDSYQYLRFQRYIIYYLIVSSIICLAVIFPTNLQGESARENAPFHQTTIENLGYQSSWLVVHAVAVDALIIICYGLMWIFSIQVTEASAPVANRTLFIRRIPKNKVDKSLIVEYFDESILKNWLIPESNKPEIEAVQFVFDIRKLSKLEKAHDTAFNARHFCEKEEEKKQMKYEIRPYFCGQFGCCCFCLCPKVDGASYYKEKQIEIEDLILSEVKNVLSKPTNSFFITFSTKEIAFNVYTLLIDRHTCRCPFRFLLKCNSCCACCNYLANQIRGFNDTNSFKEYNWDVSFAPCPNDIDWDGITTDSRINWLIAIPIYVLLFVILVFLTTPVIILNILDMVHLLPTVTQQLENIDSKLAAYFSPFLLMLISVVMPSIVLMLCSFIPHKTKSSRHYSFMWIVYLFLILAIVILPSIGISSALHFVETIIERNNTDITIGCIFPPNNGAFFIKYILQSTFLGLPFELLRLPEFLLYYFYLYTSKSQAEYEKVQKATYWDFYFGWHYAKFLSVFAVVMLYSTSCPLIVPCGLVYMVFKYLIDRYNIYYHYETSQTSGHIHSTAVLYVHFALIMMHFQVTASLFMLSGYTNMTGFSLISIILFIVSLLAHYIYHWYKYLLRDIKTDLETNNHYCACKFIPPEMMELFINGLIPERVMELEVSDQA